MGEEQASPPKTAHSCTPGKTLPKKRRTKGAREVHAVTGGVGRALLEDLRERRVRLKVPEPLPTGGRAEGRTLSEGDKQDLAENEQQLLEFLRWETADMAIGWTGYIDGAIESGSRSAERRLHKGVARRQQWYSYKERGNERSMPGYVRALREMPG